MPLSSQHQVPRRSSFAGKHEHAERWNDPPSAAAAMARVERKEDAEKRLKVTARTLSRDAAGRQVVPDNERSPLAVFTTDSLLLITLLLLTLYYSLFTTRFTTDTASPQITGAGTSEAITSEMHQLLHITAHLRYEALELSSLRPRSLVA